MSVKAIASSAVLASALATVAAGKQQGYRVALKGQSDCAAGPSTACDHAARIDVADPQHGDIEAA